MSDIVLCAIDSLLIDQTVNTNLKSISNIYKAFDTQHLFAVFNLLKVFDGDFGSFGQTFLRISLSVTRKFYVVTNDTL